MKQFYLPVRDFRERCPAQRSATDFFLEPTPQANGGASAKQTRSSENWV